MLKKVRKLPNFFGQLIIAIATALANGELHYYVDGIYPKKYEIIMS